MKNDYMYCENKGSCIHRRGCKRWVGNYLDDEVEKLYALCQFVSLVDESKCTPNYSDVDCDNEFSMLDRFRLSTGEPFKRDKEF